MLAIFKNIGKGTSYEFNKHALYTPLPSRNRSEEKVKMSEIDNEWCDKHGNKYNLSDNILLITANEFFPNEGYSVIDYINEIPESVDVTIMLKVKTKKNEVAGFNELCNMLSTYPTKKDLILNVTEMEFCETMSLDIDELPSNIKITSQMDRTLNENFIFSNQSFESWAMNCNDKDFSLLLSKLTPQTAERISRMRKICTNFYIYTPDAIKSASNYQKTLFAYDWCCTNVNYDTSATNADGTLKYERKDSQDPIVTFENRMGVCEGRARLLKLLLNNFYMRVPCFLVKGMSGRLQHTWNEILLENDTIIDLDISKQKNRIANNHSELAAYQDGSESNKSSSKRIIM